MSFKILIVDDEAELTEMLRIRLHKMGCEAEIASNGEAGIKKAETLHPDLILLDIVMEDLDGWEVAKRLEQNAATSTIPIIIFTATQPIDLESKAKECGISGILRKPYDEEELRSLIERFQNRPEAVPI